MSTLYRPVLIESSEQAEALPAGTVAFDPEETASVGIRAPESSHTPWYCSFDHDPGAYSSEVVGWTALVPIEAEEEWIDNGNFVVNVGGGDATPADVDDYERRNGSRPSRRLVTPWEESR